MRNYIIISIIIILIIFTSIVKTSTRDLEAKIFISKEQIKVLSDKKELILLENNFLSSPERLFAAINNLSEQSLVAPYKFKGDEALSVESATTFFIFLSRAASIIF